MLAADPPCIFDLDCIDMSSHRGGLITPQSMNELMQAISQLEGYDFIESECEDCE